MTMRYRTTRADDTNLRQRMRAIAQERRRFGYRRRWYRRPIRPSSARGDLPNLFEAFGEEWRMPSTPKRTRGDNKTVDDQSSIN
jgi:hypothetical protein